MSETTIEQRGELVKRLFAVRRQITELTNLHLRDLKKEEDDIEKQLLAAMVEGERIAFAGVGTVSCSSEIVPNVEDWDAVHQYIRDNNAFYLLARKLNTAPFRDSLNAGIDIPGVQPLTLRKINCRAATGK